MHTFYYTYPIAFTQTHCNDLKGYFASFHFSVPYLELDSKINILFLGDIDALVTIVLGRQHQPNDFDTLTCEHLDVKFHMGYASMELENLFGGDNDLGK